MGRLRILRIQSHHLPSTSSRLWISFNLGVISGVMRSVRGLPKLVGENDMAEWRGCEDGEGVMTFGDSNCAVLT